MSQKGQKLFSINHFTFNVILYWELLSYRFSSGELESQRKTIVVCNWNYLAQEKGPVARLANTVIVTI
jgi:hypothetical protein